MPLALEVREAVVVFAHRSVAGEVVVAFTRHLGASIRAEGLAGSIRRSAASADLLLMVVRTHLTLVTHQVFMALLHTLCGRRERPAAGSPAMR